MNLEAQSATAALDCVEREALPATEAGESFAISWTQ
jgi:hypothetical protein